jgi:hypothetical protein
VRWVFGDAAAAGTARLSVAGRRGRRIATAAVTVRPRRTMIKTLQLNRAGRRMIRPGRSLRVRLALRLPGGATVAKRLTLTRSR